MRLWPGRIQKKKPLPIPKGMKISEYNNLMRKTTRPIMIISIRAEMRYQTGNIEIFSLTYCFNKKARSKSTYQEDRNRIIRNKPYQGTGGTAHRFSKGNWFA